MNIRYLHHIYHNEVPAFINKIVSSPEMQRLKDVGMNCGCEYTGFHRFLGIGSYSRFDHSVGAALIVWHFTGDVRQAISALLHDIATPAFAHVIDFLHGDHLKQESTEDGTLRIIAGSASIMSVLGEYGLTAEDVADYHIFPIADNDTPKLSSDRLEYTCGNIINYGFAQESAVAAMYEDLCVGTNEEGQPEIMFKSRQSASEFARLSLCCSKIYVSDEDRYAMQRLAELLADAISRGVLSESGLYSAESDVIRALTTDSESAQAWKRYRSYSVIVPGGESPEARTINAKKRRIDPYVKDVGRVTSFDGEYAENLQRFLDKSLDYSVSAK